MVHGGAFPGSLFAHGEKGFWYDASDLSTLFKDTAGTLPVTTTGDFVQLMKDKTANGYNMVATSATGGGTGQFSTAFGTPTMPALVYNAAGTGTMQVAAYPASVPMYFAAAFRVSTTNPSLAMTAIQHKRSVQARAIYNPLGVADTAIFNPYSISNHVVEWWVDATTVNITVDTGTVSSVARTGADITGSEALDLFTALNTSDVFMAGFSLNRIPTGFERGQIWTYLRAKVGI